MLGYTEDDVYRMMAGIKIATSYVPSNSSNEEVHTELKNAFNFLEGMLVEGRI